MKKRVLIFILVMILFALVAVGCRNAHLEETCPPSSGAVVVLLEAEPKEEALVPVTVAQISGESALRETTRIIREPAEAGKWTHTFYNETIDYTGLRLEALAFAPESEDEALRLSVSLPETWDESLCQWMRREGLRLRFDVDGKQADAFREREILPAENDAHAYEIIYRKCILDEYDRAGQILTIRPYIDCYPWITSYEIDGAGKWSERYIRLSEGERYTRIYQGGILYWQLGAFTAHFQFERKYMEELRLALPLRNVAQESVDERAHYYEAITVDDVDWEKNIAAGFYEPRPDGDYIDTMGSPSGTLYSREKDFNEVCFILEEFRIWPEDIKLSFSLRFPNSWTNMECQSFVRDYLSIMAYVNDERPIDPYEQRSLPFGDSEKYFGNYQGEEARWHNYKTVDNHELYFRCWYSNFTVEQWKSVDKLTIVPWYFRITECDGQALSESGFAYNHVKVTNGEMVFLDKLAITIDITPDLFIDGFA